MFVLRVHNFGDLGLHLIPLFLEGINVLLVVLELYDLFCQRLEGLQHVVVVLRHLIAEFFGGADLAFDSAPAIFKLLLLLCELNHSQIEFVVQLVSLHHCLGDELFLLQFQVLQALTHLLLGFLKCSNFAMEDCFTEFRLINLHPKLVDISLNFAFENTLLSFEFGYLVENLMEHIFLRVI